MTLAGIVKGFEVLRLGAELRCNVNTTARPPFVELASAPSQAGSGTPSRPLRPRRLLYIATEDWFFRSHMMPMARAAMRAGFHVTLAARLAGAASAIALEGVCVVPLELERSRLN